MPSRKIEEQLSSGRIQTSGAAYLLGVKRWAIHNYVEAGTLKRSVPVRIRSQRETYVYDVDSIVSKAVHLMFHKHMPITKQLVKFVMTRGSENAKEALVRVNVFMKVNSIVLSIVQGRISIHQGLTELLSSIIGFSEDMKRRAKNLDIMTTTEYEVLDAITNAGQYSKYFVMRQDQKDVPNDARTFTFTSNDPNYASILAFAAVMLHKENNGAGEALLTLAIKEGFTPAELEGVSRRSDVVEPTEEELNDALRGKAPTPTPDEAANMIRLMKKGEANTKRDPGSQPPA